MATNPLPSSVHVLSGFQGWIPTPGKGKCERARARPEQSPRVVGFADGVILTSKVKKMPGKRLELMMDEILVVG